MLPATIEFLGPAYMVPPGADVYPSGACVRGDELWYKNRKIGRFVGIARMDSERITYADGVTGETLVHSTTIDCLLDL
jgi:hypothetical protein